VPGWQVCAEDWQRPTVTRTPSGGKWTPERMEESQVTDMATPLRIESRREGEGTAVISLVGEVDVANTQQVREAALGLLSGGITRLIVDLSRTDYMDSAGLGLLVGLQRRLREANGALGLAGLKAQVQRVFDVTKLNRIFAIYDDVETAVKEVGG